MKFAIPETGIALGSRRVLEPFDATFEKGSLVGIVGPNGAGKSTLIRLLAGLLPQSGEAVEVDHWPLSMMPVQDRARRIAWLSQSRELSWDLTVEDVVALGRHAWGGGRYDRLGPGDRAIVDGAIERAGAASLAGRHVLSLSGGEQARVHLARLFAVQADILLLDEPLAALDIAQQLAVLAALREETGKGRLVCLALHDLALAANTCDRLLVLKEGRLVADGPPADALNAATLKTVFGVERDEHGLFRASSGLQST